MLVSSAVLCVGVFPRDQIRRRSGVVSPNAVRSPSYEPAWLSTCGALTEAAVPMQEFHREAHVPAQQPSPFEEAWLPPADVGPCRPQRSALAPAQGPPQAQRLIEPVSFRWEFELLRESGRYRRSGPVGLRFVRAEPSSSADESPRVAFAIGRGVGNAVVRNRLRRRLRELLRSADRATPLTPGRYLFIPAPAAASMSSAALAPHVRSLLEWAS